MNSQSFSPCGLRAGVRCGLSPALYFSVGLGLAMALGACSKRENADGPAASSPQVRDQNAALPNSPSPVNPDAESRPGDGAATAMARLEATEGNKVTGTVRFTRVDGGVRVVADVDGLKPGEHGIHIHEAGDCSTADGSSAGGHFNPTHQPHGGRDSDKRHVGDLGNITADANGHAHLDFVDDRLELSGPNSIIGRGVIVHAGRDDLTSQPAGNSGARVACGVVAAGS